MDVAEWLSGLGLERYREVFAANDVDGATLARLTGEDLKELGVASIGHRRKLLDAIAALATTPGSGETADRAEACAERLQDYVRDEPLPWSTFFADWGRALAAFGRGERSQTIWDKLQQLRDEAARAGLRSALPALDAALTRSAS